MEKVAGRVPEGRVEQPHFKTISNQILTQNRYPMILNNYICISIANKNKIIIYDQYGNLLRVINQADIYYMCNMIVPDRYLIYQDPNGIINIINVKTMERGSWNIDCYTMTISYGYAWAKLYENSKEIIQLDVLTGKQIRTFNIKLGNGGVFGFIKNIFHYIYYERPNYILVYSNGIERIITKYKYIHNNHDLVLYNGDYIEVVGGKKLTISISDVELTRKYIFINVYFIYNFNLQLLYIDHRMNEAHKLRETFYINEKYESYTEITIYRYRPILTKYIKNQIQNNSYKHILRLIS